MQNSMKLAVLLAAGISTSGCTAIFGHKQAKADAGQEVDVAAIYSEYASEQLELGRSLMRAGAYSSAIEPLRKASRDRGSAPAALNAMGVAYAKIGRNEVAGRFFRQALLLDPENKAFAGNLLRLKSSPNSEPAQQDVALAVAEVKPANTSMRQASNDESSPAEREVVVLDQKSSITPAFGRDVVTSTGTGQLARVSEYEVHIGKREKSAEPARRNVVTSQYPLKIKFGRSSATNTEATSNALAYPQRVKF